MTEHTAAGAIAAIGIDLAKNVFQLHAIDAAGRWCCATRCGAGHVHAREQRGGCGSAPILDQDRNYGDSAFN
jgi:hypothetical protein